MKYLPFLKGCNWPVVDLMPSGAITIQIWLFLADDEALCSAFTALSLLLRSTGTPPNAREIHEKKGTIKSSFFASAKCLIGQVADTRNPSRLLEWLNVSNEQDSEKLLLCLCDLSGPSITSTDIPESSNINQAMVRFNFSDIIEKGSIPR